MKKKVGKYQAELQDISSILKCVGLLDEFNLNPISLNLSLSEIRKLKYCDLWKTYYKEYCYHFQLIDGSLMHFNFNNHSYNYLGCPFDCLSYKEFLHELGFDIREYKYDFLVDYEQYLAECEIKEYPFTIRYDYDEGSYNEGLHPVSHLHLGIRTQTRVGSHVILSPMNFVFFIMRQNYPEKWKMLLEDKKYHALLSTSKSKNQPIHKNYLKKMDGWELYLS